MIYIFFFNDEKQHQLLTQNRKYSKNKIDMLVMNEE